MTPPAGNGSASGYARSTRCEGQGTSRFPDQYLHEELGWSRLGCSEAQLPVGESVITLSESRMREIRTSGLMSGSVETEHGMAIEAPAGEARKGGTTDRPNLNHRATSRLYPNNGTRSVGWCREAVGERLPGHAVYPTEMELARLLALASVGR